MIRYLWLLLLVPVAMGIASPAPGPDSGGYVSLDLASDFDSIYGTGASVDAWVQNSAQRSVNLNTFDFTYYGQEITTVAIGEDGILALNDGVGSPIAASSPVPMGAGTSPNNFIAGYWTDLDVNCDDPQVLGVMHEEQGVPGKRTFVASWEKMPLAGGLPCQGFIDMQILLFEDTNIFEVHIDQATNQRLSDCQPVAIGNEATRSSVTGLAWGYSPNEAPCTTPFEIANQGIRTWENDAVDAEGQYLTTGKDEALYFDLDTSDDPLLYKLDALPSNGLLTGFPGESIQYWPLPQMKYQPNPGFLGDDTLIYTVDDGFDGPLTVTVTIHVNAAPIAHPDELTTVINTDLTFDAQDILGNDEGPEPADTLSVNSYTKPFNGNLFDNGDGTYTYSPNQDFLGTDRFTYAVEDNHGAYDTTIVNIQVTEPPVAPSAAPDTYWGRMNEQFIIAAPGVLVNDVDGNGDVLTAILVTPPPQGTVQLDPDGRVVFTPPTDFVGSLSFYYKASDGERESLSTEVRVNILENPPRNKIPIARDNIWRMEADTLLVVPAPGPMFNDQDKDGDILTLTITSEPAHGELDMEPTGEFSYLPDPGFVGEDRFTYTIHDGKDTSNEATVRIQVLVPSENIAPLARNDVFVGDRNVAMTIGEPGVLINDEDGNGDTLTVALVTDAAGDLSLAPDGTFSYTPPLDFAGTDSFTYQLFDGYEYGNTARVLLYIRTDDGNGVPMAEDDSYETVRSKITYIGSSYGVLANDVDPDAGDTLRAYVETPPTNGELVIYESGALRYQAHFGFEGTDTFTYRATDGKDFAIATVIMTVLASEGPQAQFDVTPAVQKIGRTVTFTDASTAGENDVTSYAWDFGDGNVATTPHPTHTYDSLGSFTVTLTVTDSVGQSSTLVRTGIVQIVATLPTLANFDWTTSPDVETANVPIQFGDLSIGEGPIVTWSWNFGDGTVSAKQNPVHSFPKGSYTISLTVWSNSGDHTRTKTLVVDHEAIQATLSGPNTGVVGEALQFTATSEATSWYWLANGQSHTGPQFFVSFDQVGTYVVSLTTKDAYNAASTTTWTVTIWVGNANAGGGGGGGGGGGATASGFTGTSYTPDGAQQLRIERRPDATLPATIPEDAAEEQESQTTGNPERNEPESVGIYQAAVQPQQDAPMWLIISGVLGVLLLGAAIGIALMVWRRD